MEEYLGMRSEGCPSKEGMQVSRMLGLQIQARKDAAPGDKRFH